MKATLLSLVLTGAIYSARACADDLPYYSKNPFQATISSRHGTYTRSAREQSRTLYNYVESAPSIEPEVVQEQVEEIGSNIEKAKKSLATMKGDSQKSGEVMDCCKNMEKHLAQAAKAHQELKEKVAKGELDKEGIQKCCGDICKHLEAASHEHGKMKKMVNQKDKEVPPAK